jgi:hypothetical protein
MRACRHGLHSPTDVSDEEWVAVGRCVTLLHEDAGQRQAAPGG